MTIGDLIDRIYREYLRKPDDQPVATWLTAALDGSSLTVTVSDVFTPEEEELLSAGTVVEVDSELMAVSSYNNGTLTLLTRGVMGTTAAAHDSGAGLTVSPHVSRKAVFDAVSDSIGRLYPRLFTVDTFRLSTSRQLHLLPANRPVREVTNASMHVNGEWQTVDCWVVDHPHASNGKAIRFPARLPHAMAHVTVTLEPTLPTSETDTLASLHLSDTWAQIIVIDALSVLLHSPDIGRIDVEWLTEAIEASVLPVGSVENLAVALERYRLRLITEAAQRLRITHRPSIRYRDRVF